MGLNSNLVDDLADVMARIVVGWKVETGIDLAQHDDVQRVMKRYREFKAEQEQLVIVLDTKMAEVNAVFDQHKGGDQWSQWADVGRTVEQDCVVFGTSVWQRIDGVIQRQDPASVTFYLGESRLD